MAIDQDALQNIDWVQVVLNGGPPCFHLEEDGRFCLRAEKWSGHHVHNVHKFVSLAAYAAECVRAERALNAERVMSECRQFNEEATRACKHGNYELRNKLEMKANLCERMAAAIEREG